MHLSTWPSQVIAAVALTVGGSTLAEPSQSHSRFQWWHSDQFQRELTLSADQVARIDTIFLVTLPELRQRKGELDRLEMALSRLIEGGSDAPAVERAVDKTEAARSSLNKVRTLMLVRMRQVLTPEQRVRFSTLHEERERSREAPGTRGGARGQPEK